MSSPQALKTRPGEELRRGHRNWASGTGDEGLPPACRPPPRLTGVTHTSALCVHEAQWARGRVGPSEILTLSPPLAEPPSSCPTKMGPDHRDWITVSVKEGAKLRALALSSGPSSLPSSLASVTPAFLFLLLLSPPCLCFQECLQSVSCVPSLG